MNWAKTDQSDLPLPPVAATDKVIEDVVDVFHDVHRVGNDDQATTFKMTFQKRSFLFAELERYLRLLNDTGGDAVLTIFQVV